jgi:hypothetical protein
MMAAVEKFQLDLEALACSAAHVTGQGEDLASAHVAADKRISAAQQLSTFVSQFMPAGKWAIQVLPNGFRRKCKQQVVFGYAE